MFKKITVIFTLMFVFRNILISGECIQFATLGPNINKIAKGNSKMRGHASSLIGKDYFMNKTYTSMAIKSVSGLSTLTFYSKPGTACIDFVKVTFNGSDMVNFLEPCTLASTVILAANKTTVSPLKEIIDLTSDAIKTGKSTSKKIGSCEIMCVNFDDSLFYVISFITN